MKTLTVRQPYASLIANGAKPIETRSWSTRYRGPLVIHAGLALPEHGLRLGPGGAVVTQEYLVSYPAVPSARSVPVLLDLCNEETIPLPLGAVVASCVLADVVPIRLDDEGGDEEACIERDGDYLHFWPAGGVEGSESDVSDQLPFGDFTPGRFAWLLEDVKPTTERCPACWGSTWDYNELGCPVCAVPCEPFQCPCHAPEWCAEDPTIGCDLCRAYHGRLSRGVCDPIPAKGRQGLWTWTPVAA